MAGENDEIEKMEKILKNIKFFDQDAKMENFLARLEARMKFYDIKEEKNKKNSVTELDCRNTKRENYRAEGEPRKRLRSNKKIVDYGA